jgi:hypothetical protein
VILSSFFIAPLLSFPQEQEEDVQVQISESVSRGVDFLLDEQLPDGSWDGWADKYPSGISSLCVFALLQSDVPNHHPAIIRALEYLRTVSPQHTYNTGFLLLALASTEDEQHQEWAKTLTNQLLDWQAPSGLWTYPGGAEDLSNTMIAVLGLDAASRMGVKVEDDVWLKALDGVELCIGPEEYLNAKEKAANLIQGFSYTPRSASSGSMASAGITIHSICKEQLGKALSKRKRKFWEKQAQLALAWINANWSLKTNPPNRSWHFFHLWGYERIGAYLNIEKLGSHSWYNEGVSKLIGDQKSQGGWFTGRSSSGFTVSEQQSSELQTSLGLLFLNRATNRAVTGGALPSKSLSTPEGEEVVLSATGDTPMTIWVSQSDLPPTSAKFFVRRLGEKEWGLITEDTDTLRGFSTQHSFQNSGLWEIRCEIETEGGVLKSSILKVKVQLVLDPSDLKVAREAKLNLFQKFKKEITASSSRSGHEPHKAFDNLLGRAWVAAHDDSNPWIEVKIREPFRANKLLFLDAFPRRYGVDSPQLKLLKITINGRKRYEVSMPEDRWKKGVLEFKSKKLIRTLRVELVGLEGNQPSALGSGLSEIEAQLAK